MDRISPAAGTDTRENRLGCGSPSARKHGPLPICCDPGSAQRAASSSSGSSAPKPRTDAATVRAVRERRAPIAIVAIVAAVIGGISVLVVGKAAGWLSTGTKKTVVVQTPAIAQAVATPKAAVSSSAKPLVGNGFNPSRIYRTRAPGVVTILRSTAAAAPLPRKHRARASSSRRRATSSRTPT